MMQKTKAVAECLEGAIEWLLVMASEADDVEGRQFTAFTCRSEAKGLAGISGSLLRAKHAREAEAERIKLLLERAAEVLQGVEKDSNVEIHEHYSTEGVDGDCKCIICDIHRFLSPRRLAADGEDLRSDDPSAFLKARETGAER